MKRRKPPSQRQKPKDLAECLAMVAKIQVAFARQMGGRGDGCDPDDKIRADIKAAFQEAIEGDAEYKIKFQHKDGTPDTGITMAGAFRTVFNLHRLDRKDPWQQERWWEIVSEAMEWAIAQNDGGYQRKTG